MLVSFDNIPVDVKEKLSKASDLLQFMYENMEHNEKTKCVFEAEMAIEKVLIEIAKASN